MGKPKSWPWTQFNEVVVGEPAGGGEARNNGGDREPRRAASKKSKTVKARCNHCLHMLTTDPQRMLRHLVNQCDKASGEVKAEAKRRLLEGARSRSSTAATSIQQDYETGSPGGEFEERGPAAPPLCAAGGGRQQDIRSRNGQQGGVVTISREEMNKQQLQFARAMYKTGLPLSVFGDVEWLKTFHMINPAFRLPGKDKLGGSLLDSHHASLEGQVKERLLNARGGITLISDGWSNLRSESIINFMAATPQPFFVKALATGKESHTAENMAREFKVVIEDCGG